MYRKGEYDRRLSERLQNLDYAQGYLLGLFEEEEFTPEKIMRIFIERIGITEFAKLVGEKKSNVSSFLNGRRKLKEETFNKYLKPFKLQIVKSIQKVA
jgi:antitoxin component HigA of HigAB toxin-antitoxin module